MEKRNLKDLIPYDKNPRKNDGAVDKVLESLMRHGQVKPIVVSEKGKPFKDEVVCAGHTTLRALERFGAKEAFVVVKAFADEAQFVDYNIRDNKVAEFAEWDQSQLAELKGEFDVDLSEMGFVDFEDVDYSILDEEDDEEAEAMAEDVKKSIQIEFEIEDYEKAKELVDQARKDGVYIGGKLIDSLNPN